MTVPGSAVQRQRRRWLLRCACGAGLGVMGCVASAQPAPAGRRWYEAALAMRRQAQSTGDQPYGAVLVLDGRIVGEGPSRVVLRGDRTAHAEREAIRDAQRRLGQQDLAGALLYSTSRPCGACEAAAAAAGVERMVFGEGLEDAGRPRER
jgi:tRNA(Arg) A34 adenosine deaminase TadA